MNGYSASLEGWTDQRGEQVWLPASKVHRELRWQQLREDLAERERSPQEREAGSNWRREARAQEEQREPRSAVGRAQLDQAERAREQHELGDDGLSL